MKVLLIARKYAAIFFRRAAACENCDAIPTFLAVPNRAVAGVANGSDWEFLLGRLELLETHDIGLGLAEPTQQYRQAPVDPVHVVSGNLHAEKVANMYPKSM